tara:strand:- start:4620 stop:5294 length:675 start_codon:yes stop_codon:yes gene_type:complete
LERAATHGVLCARFEWYSAPQADHPNGSNLLGSDLFLGERLFGKLEETFRFADPLHPNIEALNHVLIYLFDGRARLPKFHAHLWRPSMGRDLLPYEYFDPTDPNPYLPYVMGALRKQDTARTVSTVIDHAFAKVRKSKAAGLLQTLPMEAHRPLLRDTLMGLRHSDPLICFTMSDRENQPHVDRGSMIEHLSIYDRKPTWRRLNSNSINQIQNANCLIKNSFMF